MSNLFTLCEMLGIVHVALGIFGAAGLIDYHVCVAVAGSCR